MCPQSLTTLHSNGLGVAVSPHATQEQKPRGAMRGPCASWAGTGLMQARLGFCHTHHQPGHMPQLRGALPASVTRSLGCRFGSSSPVEESAEQRVGAGPGPNT